MLVWLMPPDPDEYRTVLAGQLGHVGMGGGMGIPAWQPATIEVTPQSTVAWVTGM